MNYQPIDFKMLYTQWYKKLPIITFWVTTVSIWLFGVMAGFATLESDATAGAAIILGAALLGLLLGWLSFWLSAIRISQKVVATDALCELQEQMKQDAEEE